MIILLWMLRVLRLGILLHNLCVLQSHLKESGLVYRSKATGIDLTVLAARDSDGTSLLHHAAEYGQSLEFCRVLFVSRVVCLEIPFIVVKAAIIKVIEKQC